LDSSFFRIDAVSACSRQTPPHWAQMVPSQVTVSHLGRFCYITNLLLLFPVRPHQRFPYAVTELRFPDYPCLPPPTILLPKLFPHSPSCHLPTGFSFSLPPHPRKRRYPFVGGLVVILSGKNRHLEWFPAVCLTLCPKRQCSPFPHTNTW